MLGCEEGEWGLGAVFCSHVMGNGMYVYVSKDYLKIFLECLFCNFSLEIIERFVFISY